MSAIKFYDTKRWRRRRRKVLELDKYECQLCKANKVYKRATIVHHVNHLEDRPDLGLSVYYTDENGQQHRNLISVCKDCHETVCHPERLREPPEPLTADRWD